MSYLLIIIIIIFYFGREHLDLPANIQIRKAQPQTGICLRVAS